MDKYFKLILTRMIIITFVFVIVGFIFDKFIGIGICIGGFFSFIQFVFFKRNLAYSVKNKKLPNKSVLSYFIKLTIAILLAIGIAQFSKILAIGFLIGLPAMQLAIMSTAFNKKVLESFMSE